MYKDNFFYTKVAGVLTSRSSIRLESQFLETRVAFQVVHTIRCGSRSEFQLNAFPRKELWINTRCQLVITMFLRAYQFSRVWQVTFPQGKEQKGVSSWLELRLLLPLIAHCNPDAFWVARSQTINIIFEAFLHLHFDYLMLLVLPAS